MSTESIKSSPRPAQNEIVTRFAPSPTGHLHIGGVRTALYNWLYARRHQGRFLLRIEDTDRERSLPEYEEDITEGLKWLGLDWDIKPIRQSERSSRYQQILDLLLGSGAAYRCSCTTERLDSLRQQQIAQRVKPGYDGHCRRAGIGADNPHPFVIRLLSPDEGTVTINDTLRRTINVANSELDDMILARSDGTPTYQLSAVVDDIDSNISHVIRGDDHLNNTLRQAHLYRALGEIAPVYTHLPLILDEAGKRYSKRTAGADLSMYRRQGIVADALLNYLLRLGWSHGDQEFFHRQEMIELFDLEGLNRSSCSFNPGKLDWLNRRHIQQLDPTQLRQSALSCFELHTRTNSHNTEHNQPTTHDLVKGSDPPNAVNSPPSAQDGIGCAKPLNKADIIQSSKDEVKTATELSAAACAFHKEQLDSLLNDKIILASRTKAKDLIDLLNLAVPLMCRNEQTDEQLLTQYEQPEQRQIIDSLIDFLESFDEWPTEDMTNGIKTLVKELGIKMPQLALPARFALLGEINRLAVSDILVALGPEESLARLRAFARASNNG